jgi:hypothetical protein
MTLSPVEESRFLGGKAVPKFSSVPYCSLEAQRHDVNEVKMDLSEINHGMVREVSRIFRFLLWSYWAAEIKTTGRSASKICE